MKLKGFIAISIILLVLFCSIPAQGFVSRNKIIEEKKEIISNFTTEDEDEYGDILTFIYGPIKPKYVELTEIEGNQTAVDKIEAIFNGNIPVIANFIPSYPVIAVGINFTLTFKQNERAKSRFSYFSILFENNTEDFSYMTNKVHSVRVTNFTGVFVYNKAQFFKANSLCPRKFFVPARFQFFGFSTDAEIIES